MNDLVEVRCPFDHKAKDSGNIYKCNMLIVQVTVGSSGKAYCKKCRLSFMFDVNSQSKMVPHVKVQQIT